jgi:hypothetical protein
MGDVTVILKDVPVDMVSDLEDAGLRDPLPIVMSKDGEVSDGPEEEVMCFAKKVGGTRDLFATIVARRGILRGGASDVRAVLEKLKIPTKQFDKAVIRRSQRN